LALFHFHVTQIKRSAGQSIVTSAAYRAGEKLFSEYYSEVSDYTHKGGVVCTDILLPPQAPAEYLDRATLWNTVEKAERGKKAQLAYSFDIALQNEFSMEENIALARQFVSEQLVGRGMISDFAIHQPDKKKGGIPNPHFHILCPIRPIESDGKWGCKQRRRYRLDKDGNRIMGEDGKPQGFDLAALLTAYYEGRNAGTWSRNAKIGNLKNFAEAVNYLTEKGITTLEGLEAHIAAQSKRTEAVSAALKAMSARKKELEDLLHYTDLYRETKPIYAEWKGIKWKGRREKFELAHEGDLKAFQMDRRKLGKFLSPAGNPPVQAWRQELDALKQKYQTEYKRYKPIQDDLWKLQQVKRNADTALRQQDQTRQKRRDMEH